MDTKKIGEFLKVLRKERGLTQEQLAEILLVSGRTISRWETGTNMPDLSILIKMAEFYNVEVKEILDGERKSENMDKELKETLSKVADYNKLEKERVTKAGNIDNHSASHGGRIGDCGRRNCCFTCWWSGLYWSDDL